MDILHVLAYLSAVLIGITLGIFGGGGSILTLPVLVYLIGYDSAIGISYSMFIVGIATLIGAINSYFKKTLNLKAAYSFGIPSLIAVFLTRKFITPHIEKHVWHIQQYDLTGKHLLMFLFAVLMIIVALFMIFKKNKEAELLSDTRKRFYFGIIVKALLVGFISGLIGAGGGFIIVPAMIAFYKLDTKTAVGTSMIIIAANSLVGFFGNMNQYVLDWTFLASFSALCIAGVLVGGKISEHIKNSNLKRSFGYFVLVMGVFVFTYEIFLKK